MELWELVYASGPGTHPVHVHLVDFQVISRTGAGRGVLPYEAAGLKDVVLLAPGETVRVLAYYGPWNGLYIFHCHNLPHEDHVRPFKLTQPQRYMAVLTFEADDDGNFQCDSTGGTWV